MSTNRKPALKLALAAACAALLAACASTSNRATQADIEAARRGPGNTPQRNVTDFSPALRCMDDTLYAFGTRDIVILVEELQDQTRRLGVGTRDMMVSAVSDMTRRSRAVRFLTFGQDNFNVVNLLQQLEKRSPFGVLPQYDIRGSVTQFDEDVVRKEASVGIFFQQIFGLRLGNNTQYNILGFDASVISVPELSLVPGVASKNTVIVARDVRSADDGFATIQKVGLNFNFNMSVSRNAGVAQALRNMIELSSIELIGKLTRVPYWNCLGIPTDHPEIKREIEDWFFGMRDDAERNKFFQEQLRFRKFFDGPIDGKPSAALEHALAAYKKGLGFAETTPTDVGFFAEFLTRPVPAAPKEPFSTGPAPAANENKPDGAAATSQPAAPGGDTSNAKPSSGADGSKPVTAPLTLTTLKPSYKIREEIEIAVQAERTGYLYCYIQPSAGGAIQRIYPNRSVRDPRIEANEMLFLPGGRGFKITADKPGAQKIACMAAPREIYNDLPPPLRWGDFEDVKLKTFAEIKNAFEKTGKAPVVMDEVTVEIRG